MTDAKTLTANMVKHLDALAALGGKFTNASALIRQDLEGLTEAQVDAFNKAARQHYRDTIQNEDKRDAALALLAKVVAVHRKAKGFAGKRKAGAGRKAKDAKDADKAEASAVDQYQAAANYLMTHWMDVTDEQRKVALSPLAKRISEWASAGYKSKA